MEQLAQFQALGPGFQPPWLLCRIPASTPDTLFFSRTVHLQRIFPVILRWHS